MAEVHYVVGAGFSGLLTAYFLRKKGHEVVLFEPAVVGGLIQSRRTPEGLVESAANGFLLSPLLLEVTEDLGLKFARPRAASKNRYFSGTALRRWPLSWGETLRAIFGFIGARLVREHLPTPKESLTAWGRRVFGRGFAEKIIHVAVQGIYGATGDQLSADLIVTPFFKRPKQKLPKNTPRGTVSFPEGMGEFIAALGRSLSRTPGFTLRNEKVTAEQVRAWSENPAIDGVWIATATGPASELCAKVSPELAKALREIPRVPIVTGTFFFERSLKDPVGFGCLRDPELEEPGAAVLGVLFNDQIFEGRSDLRSETWIMGGRGPKSSAFLEQSDAEIEKFVLTKRHEMLGLNAACIGRHIQIWPEALPLYGSTLAEKQRLFQQGCGKIRLVGNYVAGIGLTKIADDIHSRVDNSFRPFTPVQD